MKLMNNKKLSNMKKFSIFIIAVLSIFTAQANRTLVRVVEYEQPSIQTKFGEYIQTKINEVMTDNTTYFYEIVKNDHLNTMISYEELVIINKYISDLVCNAEEDLLKKYKSIELKYVTKDGLQIGYYIKRSKISWFIQFGPSKDEIIYIKNKDVLVESFMNAQKTIEEIMKSKKQ